MNDGWIAFGFCVLLLLGAALPLLRGGSTPPPDRQCRTTDTADTDCRGQPRK